MNEMVTTVFGLLGGLAMFLLGMNEMSSYLQKACGEKMKKVLSFLTKNPVLGVLSGALVTAILQSSSATTVMTIGFVSAGLMSLPQAIFVIFGANIGTTMTAQLIAFDISDYIFPIFFIGFLMIFLAKNEQIRNIGGVVFYFGLLFEGIEIMSGTMKPLAGDPVFTELMGKVRDMPALGLLLGLVMTLIVQSSSATIAILQGFAKTPLADGVTSVIGLTGAIPILLGDNIGTTITALLASIGQSRDAKRTAIAHSIFNISGSILALIFLKPFTSLVRFISPHGAEVAVISRQIANAHTTFNVINTMIWLPLIPLMVFLVTRIIRDKAEDKAPGAPRFLDDGVLGQPVAAMTLVRKEVAATEEDLIGFLQAARDEVLGGGAVDPEAFNEKKHAMTSVSEATEKFISALFAGGSLTAEQAEEAASLMSQADDMSRIIDRTGEIVGQARGIFISGQDFSLAAGRELSTCFDVVLSFISDTISGDRLKIISDEADRRKKLRKAEKRFLRQHLRRVESGACPQELTGSYRRILYSFDRLVDSTISIMEEKYGEEETGTADLVR